MRRLFRLAALVMFVFALVATTRGGSGFTFLSTLWYVWLTAGFVAGAACQVLAEGVTKG